MAAFLQRRFAVAALAAAAAALVAGCAMRDAPALDVRLVSVGLVDAQPLEQRFLLGLRFTNYTDRDVAIDGLTYRLEINGREFATGASSQAFTVPRFGEARVDVTASSTLSGVLAQLDEIRRRLAASPGTAPSLSYRLSGRANTSMMGTSFDTQSELPFPLASR
jgi:LEA14-like dessication related protein